MKFKLHQLAEPVPESLMCHICKNLMLDPRVLKCGHTFCVDCIQSMDVCGICDVNCSTQDQYSNLIVGALAKQVVVNCKNRSNGCTKELPAIEMMHHEQMCNCKGTVAGVVEECKKAVTDSSTADPTPHIVDDEETVVESHPDLPPSSNELWYQLIPKNSISDTGISLSALFDPKLSPLLFNTYWRPWLKYRPDGWVRPYSYEVSASSELISMEMMHYHLLTRPLSSHSLKSTT